MVATLEATHYPEFVLTKKHRTGDPLNAADTPYRFDQDDLSQYDEIWLLGRDGPANGSTGPISDAEIAAIAAFMNEGGGVFATGDHEDLGADLSGHIPRVRSMRKWFVHVPGANPDPLPAGWPEAPTGLEGGQQSVGTPHRHDTLQPDANGAFYFDNQSDDIPQPLILTRLFGTAHPIFYGRRGEIDHFPDHMHEGEVIPPWNGLDVPIVNGAAFDEYPDVGSGRPLPEVVAVGTVIGGHVTPSTEGVHPSDLVPTVATAFGVVGVYDGHTVGVGRVVVDSTWHHFFDINLIGDPAATDPSKHQGFDTPKGAGVLEDMQDYYRNLAMWLAPANTKADSLARLSWLMFALPPLNEIIRPRHAHRTPLDVLALGRVARNLVTRFAPEHLVLDWIYAAISRKRDEIVKALPPRPWRGLPQESPPAVAYERLLEATLGGILQEVAPLRQADGHDDDTFSQLVGAVQRGALNGIDALVNESVRTLRSTEHFIRDLQDASEH